MRLFIETNPRRYNDISKIGIELKNNGDLTYTPSEALLCAFAHSTMAYLNSRPRTPEVCPVCGEDVPPRALACPECGADHNSGWKLDTDLGGIEEAEFDYDDFVKNEFGSSPKPSGISPLWWITGIILLIALIAALMLGAF